MHKFAAIIAVIFSMPPLLSQAQVPPEEGKVYPNLLPSGGGGNSAAIRSTPHNKSTSSRSSAEMETRTYQAGENPDLTPEKALQQQNGAIQQYTKLGYQLESKRQWEQAEKAFQYVLKVSAIRDGVGSPKMKPILQHLAVVTSEQGRTQEAIGFQERVFGFAKNQPDPLPIINAGITLTELYLKRPDLEKAESTAQEIYQLSQNTTTLAETKKQEIAQLYGTVLRKTRKDDADTSTNQPASSQNTSSTN